MRTTWKWSVILLGLATLYASGLAHGRPRPAYSPSTTQNAWLNPATIYHPDEFAYVGIPYRMLLTGDWNPHYYHNPSLTLYANGGLFWLGGADALPHDVSHDDRAIAPFQLYVMGRWMSALYTLLTVALIYASGKRVFGSQAGKMAAILTALSPLTVEHAHYATPVALTTLMTTAALFAAILILKRNRPFGLPPWGLYLTAGLLTGLSISARYNAALIGLVTGLVMLKDCRSNRRWGLLLIGSAAMPVGFALGTPGIVFATREVIDQIRDILDWYQQRGGGPGFTTSRGLDGIFYHWRYLVIIAAGPVGVGAALAGLVTAWRPRRPTQQGWMTRTLALYILTYTVLALPGRRLQANLLPLLVVPLALLAGFALSRLPRRWQPIGLSVVVLWPIVLAMLFVYRITVPDTRMRAQAWIYEHIPRGTRVYLLEPYNVPLDPRDYMTYQTYAREASPTDVQHADAQIVVYSDAYPWVVLRDRSLASPAAIACEQGILQALEQYWIPLVHFERMPWPGERIAPDDVSYWHQMGITIYCHPAHCPIESTRK